MTNEPLLWTYESRGRTPLHIGCLIFARLLAGIGLTYSAPWWWQVGIVLVALPLLWLIVADPWRQFITPFQDRGIRIVVR